VRQTLEFFGDQQQVKSHSRIDGGGSELSARPGHIFEMLRSRRHGGP